MLKFYFGSSAATWNFTYTNAFSYQLTLTAHFTDFQKASDNATATPIVDLDPNPNPNQSQNTTRIPNPFLLTPLCRMCITSVLQNVFYLHRLAEFISFFMPHQQYICTLGSNLSLCSMCWRLQLPTYACIHQCVCVLN